MNAGNLQKAYNAGTLGTQQGGVVHTYASGTVSRVIYLNSTASSAIYSGGEGLDTTYIISATANQLSSNEKISIDGSQQYAVALLNEPNSSQMSAFFYSYDSTYAYPQIWLNPQDNAYYLSGEGTSESPYRITTPQLFGLIGKSLQVTELTSVSLPISGDYVQPVNLYFDGVDTNFANAGSFTPVGLDEATGQITAFEGTYYGNSASGRTVLLSGLDIRTAHTSVALFATVASGAVIDGLELVDSSITTSTTSPFNMAAFAATNNGTISNCVNKADIIFTMQSSHDNGTVAAGIAASSSGRVLLCANLGEINVANPNNTTGASSFAAGLVGTNSGSIERSYNAGYINGGQSGGLACTSSSGSVIAHSFNIAEVNAIRIWSGSSHWEGGLVCNPTGASISYSYNIGNCDVGISTSSAGSMTHVYYLNATSNVGIYGGNSTDNRITVNQLAGMTPLSGSSYFLNIFNASGTFWEYDRTYTSMDSLPYQFAHVVDNKCEKTYAPAMQISVDGYHLVDSIAKMSAIGNSFNSIYYGVDGNYRLTTDLNYNSSAFTVINDFSGKFDGNGHTISNPAQIVSSSYTQLGMFTRLIGNAEVKNLTVSNFSVNNTSSNSDVSAGILAGRIGLGVVVESVTIQGGFAQSPNNTGAFAGSISSVDSATGGYIRGVAVIEAQVFLAADTEPNCPTGGFVGWCNGGQISSSYYAHSSLNTGDGNTSIWGVWRVGGFVGVVEGNSTISNCFAYGSVYSGRRTSSGLNDNRDSVGGFVGINTSSSVTISNCYAYVVISGYGDRYSLTQQTYYRSRGFGRNNGNGNFSNNYCYNGSNANQTAGATELSADQLRSQSSFSGWDFTNTWQMSSSSTIPYGSPIPRATQRSVEMSELSVNSKQINPNGDFTTPVTSSSIGGRFGCAEKRRSQ